jgi:hypothetical protein
VDTDALPSHAYLTWQYAYPLNGYPYQRVIDGNDAARAPESRDGAHLLSIVSARKLPMILARVFDEAQFLAPTGVRSLSKAHDGHPFVLDLVEAADELATRLLSTFLPGPDGVRPHARPTWARMPAVWHDRLQFHEYFHGDTGAGLGASHQTGWTALVVDLIAQLAARRP